MGTKIKDIYTSVTGQGEPINKNDQIKGKVYIASYDNYKYIFKSDRSEKYPHRSESGMLRIEENDIVSYNTGRNNFCGSTLVSLKEATEDEINYFYLCRRTRKAVRLVEFKLITAADLVPGSTFKSGISQIYTIESISVENNLFRGFYYDSSGDKITFDRLLDTSIDRFNTGVWRFKNKLEHFIEIL